MHKSSPAAVHGALQAVHGTRNYQTPSLHGSHDRSTDLFTAAGALVWYTGALTGSLPVAQVYDAGPDRARVRAQCAFPGSQSSSWQRCWLQGGGVWKVQAGHRREPENVERGSSDHVTPAGTRIKVSTSA